MDFTKVTAYLDALEENYGVHGLDCKIMKCHETVYRHMVGHRDYERTVPVSANDLYDVYSCTKILTMVAVMQLVEQGKLDLNDEVSKYLPEYAHMQIAADAKLDEWPVPLPTADSPLVPAKNPILIHDLMSMTAGLSYDVASEPIEALRSSTNNQASTREMIRAIAKMPLLFEPGTRYFYSLSHDVLAAVVEVVSGVSFGAYMKMHVFDPLEAEDMYYQLTEAERSRLSAQYAVDAMTGSMVPTQEMVYRLSDQYESGGAGLTCTVDAYSKVLDALANDGIGATGAQILKPSSIQTMSKNWLNAQQLKDFSRHGKVGYGYGLGVRALLDSSASKSPMGEFGWDGAAGAYAVIDPVNHISIFYAQEILRMDKVYSEIHPTLRDLIYEALEA